jgi:hypothetical protein
MQRADSLYVCRACVWTSRWRLELRGQKVLMNRTRVDFMLSGFSSVSLKCVRRPSEVLIRYTLQVQYLTVNLHVRQ